MAPASGALLSGTPTCSRLFLTAPAGDRAWTGKPHAPVDIRRLKADLRRMKIKDAEILIIPGYTNSGPDHWQTRWQAGIATARRVEQDEWTKPVREDWIKRVREEIDRAEKPVVLVAHSLGVAAAIHAVRDAPAKVCGGFFVAPPDVENPALRPKHLMTFGPYPREPLSFPSFVLASRNDRFCAFDKATDIAADWGSLLIDAGESGHINAESGHGPWPEGLMVFAQLMQRIRPAH